MLRLVIIITGTGTLLFEKVWVRSTHTDNKIHLFASLLTTMQEFSKQTTGLLVTYMEFGTVSISMVSDDKTNLRCIVYHDKDEGLDFGRLIASQILRGFIELYKDTDFTHTPIAASQFNSYANKVAEVISQSVRSILQQLKDSRTGINNALLMYDDGTAHCTNGLDDHLGIVANLQAMITFASDIMLSKEDHTRIITLDMMRQKVLVHRVGRAFLVCVCSKNKDPLVYKDKIVDAVNLLEKVFKLRSDLGNA